MTNQVQESLKAKKTLAIAKEMNKPQIYIKRGVTGEVLRNNIKPITEPKKDRKDIVKELMDSGLNFSETAKKMRIGRNLISYYVKKIVLDNGVEGEKWLEGIKKRTAKNKRLKISKTAELKNNLI